MSYAKRGTLWPWQMPRWKIRLCSCLIDQSLWVVSSCKLNSQKMFVTHSFDDGHRVYFMRSRATRGKDKHHGGLRIATDGFRRQGRKKTSRKPLNSESPGQNRDEKFLG